MLWILKIQVSCIVLLAILHCSCGELNAIFTPSAITVKISDHQNVKLVISGLNISENANVQDVIKILSSDEDIARVCDDEQILFIQPSDETSWEAHFNVSGIFLGTANLNVVFSLDNNLTEISSNALSVTVVRPKRLIDEIFMLSLVIALLLISVNFGAALNLGNIKKVFLRPIGPAICCAGQFAFMPLVSYALGLLLFQDHELGHAFALGIFFCGVAPGGGLSNFWTLLFGGNIELSVAMTTVSTFAAFGMIPLWMFTLGVKIFEKANLTVPYANIMMMAVSLVVPLAIGVFIRKFKPNIANFLVRILKSSILVIMTIVVTAAIFSNLYMTKIFTWQVRSDLFLIGCGKLLILVFFSKIIIAGMALPLSGYFFGWFVTKLLCQPKADGIAISIEIGLQNSAFAMILLNFALGQPTADIATAVPIAVAGSTLLTLIAAYIVYQIKLR